MKLRKAPHCGALWPGRGRLRLRPFILCFYRTAFTAQKSGLKSLAFRSQQLPRISPKSYRHNAVPNRFSISLTSGPRLLSRAKAGTYSAFGEGSHTAAYTLKQGRFGRGWYHYPRTVPHVSETLRGQGVERQTLPLLGLGWMYFRRTQRAFGTAMCLCASLFRGVAAPLGCVICLQLGDVAVFFTLCAVLSERARWGWYHYPRCALCAAETPDGRLSKRLICRFLRSGGRSSPHDSYFLANTQNFLLAVPVANAFALWYDKFSKLKFI